MYPLWYSADSILIRDVLLNFILTIILSWARLEPSEVHSSLYPTPPRLLYHHSRGKSCSILSGNTWRKNCFLLQFLPYDHFRLWQNRHCCWGSRGGTNQEARLGQPRSDPNSPRKRGTCQDPNSPCKWKPCQHLDEIQASIPRLIFSQGKGRCWSWSSHCGYCRY